MKTSTKSLAMAAAIAGLLGGTTVRVNAQPTQNTSVSAHAGVLLAQSTPDTTKHSCKGKNDCKGQGGGDAKHAGKNSCKGKGGCKSGDNGCKGQNSCKGKGGCATDGSKPPA